MIWSTPARQVEELTNAASKRGLRTSFAIHPFLAALGRDYEPVRYVNTLPPHSSARLIIPSVTLSDAGYLQHPSKGFYGVATEAWREKNYNMFTKVLFMEANAMAERTALSRGLYTEHGRATAEQQITGVLPRHFQGVYAVERIEYLKDLIFDARDTEADFGKGNRDALIEQLALGITALEAFID